MMSGKILNIVLNDYKKTNPLLTAEGLCAYMVIIDCNRSITTPLFKRSQT